MKKQNKRQRLKTWASQHQKTIKRIGIIAGIYFISMFLPIFGGYTAYPVAIVRCGHLPVITNNFMAANDYSEPGMVSYSGPSWLEGYGSYVCSAQEAESHGYHKAPW